MTEPLEGLVAGNLGLRLDWVDGNLVLVESFQMTWWRMATLVHVKGLFRFYRAQEIQVFA